ncbi:RNA-directed DNA polymerase, eukaryota [Tanacetum coccineum]
MGDEEWKKVSYRKRRVGLNYFDLPSIQTKPHIGRYRSKEEDLEKISVSVFVTNIPDSCSAKELFIACKQYGHVVDSFIANKKSKAGKRFGFVRFINVFSEERLVTNLGTVWIGRTRLHANLAKFKRPTVGSAKNTSYEAAGTKSNGGHSKSSVHVKEFRAERSSVNFPRFASPRHGVPDTNRASYGSVLKGNNGTLNNTSLAPAMVLDDECLVNHNFDLVVMGEIKDFHSLNNLYCLLSKEGFINMKIAYLGGLWVMIELTSALSKEKFMNHVGVASWFREIRNPESDFVSKERIAWVDIEGVPLRAWSRTTFTKIGSRWGEVMDMEDCKDDCFGRKRICIKTAQEDNILEKFKIIIRGKNFVIRAKELFVWTPTFKGNTNMGYSSEDESYVNADGNNDENFKEMNGDDDCEVKGVSDTIFGDQEINMDQNLDHKHDGCWFLFHTLMIYERIKLEKEKWLGEN